MSKHGENIYKRKDGRWEGRIRITTPEKKLLSVYGKSYREVKEKLRETQNSYIAREKKENIGTVIQNWLSFKAKTLKASSMVKYRNLSNKHILPLLGNAKVSSLSEDVLIGFVRKVSDGETNEKIPLSPKTVRDILMILKSAILSSGKIAFPQIAIDSFLPTQRKKKIRILSVAEQNHLESCLLRFPNEKCIGLLLCLYTGLRIGEICALKWCNVNLKEKTLKIDATLQRLQLPREENGKRTSVVFSTPKSAESNRNIPIADFLIPILKSLQPKNRNAYFLSGTEKFVEPRCYEKYYKKMMKDGGLNCYNFHALRHTFATRCVESGMDVKALSEMLGHSTVRLTLDRYVHPTMLTKQLCINRMALSRQKMWSEK